jgi:hypothetical protein
VRPSRPLLRTATALAATVLATLPGAISGAPALAAGQTTIDVLTVVDGEYLVETVSVPAAGAPAPPDRLEEAPEVVAASPSVTYEVQGTPDPIWDDTGPGEASHVRTAWPRTRGAGQIVAVLDTAGDPDHPDLAGALTPGTDTVGGAGDPWHGTAVAGVIAARADNGIGSAGMAPDAKVMPVRVCNDGGCPSAAIAEGVLWAADHGADVINMSLAGTGFSDVMAAAIRYALDKNISVVASAGNEGLSGNPVMYPAANSGVIAVSATTPTGAPADWAVHGWQADIATVGEGVLLTMPGGGYRTGDGTSFASPAVAGAVALVRASHPGISVEAVQSALQASVDSSTWDRAWGAGRLDVPAALDAADRATVGVIVTPGEQAVAADWAPVSGATGYTVRVDGRVGADVPSPSASVFGLNDGNQVAIDVQPSNGARSRPILVTVGEAGPGTPVLHSAALGGTSAAATLTLNASVTGAPIADFSLVRDGVSVGTYRGTLTGTPRSLLFQIGARPPYGTRWQLQGVGDYGRVSPYSNALTTGAATPAPPAAVTGLAGQVVDDEVLLGWDSPGSAYTYRVSVAGDVVASPRTAGVSLPAPPVGETRTYSVVAVDAWGQTGPAVTTAVPRIAKPVMTTAPAVVGTLDVGSTVSTPDAFTGADTVTHAWRVCGPGGCAALVGDVTHVITAAEAGKQLEVEATARNAGGVTSAISAQSALVGSDVPVTVPGAPGIRTATAGDGSATVRWSAPASNGGAPITGYSVEAYRAGGLVSSTTVPADATRTVVPGLSNGSAHTFTVTAINSVGPGDPSAFSAAVTPAVPVVAPSAPGMGTPVPGNGSVLLRWAPPVDDGGAPIKDYRVRVYRGMTQLSMWTTTATELHVPGLANGTAHTFSLTARNSAGSGLAAGVVATPRTVPRGVVIGVPSAAPAAAVVRWSAPVSDGGSPVVSYSIRVYRGSALVKVVYAPGTATSTTVTGLLNGSGHSFIVAANNVAGAGPASARSATVVPRSRPSAPKIAWVNAGRGSATVRWGPPYNGGTPVTAYVVRAYRGTTLVKSVPVVARTTLLSVGGLTPGAVYTFTVTAVNALGWSLPSARSGPIAPLR